MSFKFLLNITSTRFIGPTDLAVTIRKDLAAQSARAVEYTDSISAKG